MEIDEMIPANTTGRFLSAVILGLAFMAAPAQADSITFSVSGGAGWQNGSNFPSLEPGSTTTSGPLPSGTPFWDGNSSDGPKEGIGYLLTGTGAFSKQYISPSSLYYLGNANGSAPAVETFQSSSTVTTTYIASIAGYSNVNQVGILDETTGSIQSISGGGSTLITINPTDTYAFILQRSGANNDPVTFISDTGYNSGGLASTDGTNQHFAIFSNNPNGNGPFYVGVEDLPYASSDMDFNDFVFEMQAVPEPASLILFGLGALGMCGYSWRKRK
jgi:hypothetical protein